MKPHERASDARLTEPPSTAVAADTVVRETAYGRRQRGQFVYASAARFRHGKACLFGAAVPGAVCSALGGC